MSSSSRPIVIGASTSKAARTFVGPGTPDTSPLVRLFTLPGVFRPRPDSWMLARWLRAEPLPPGARVLDVCTGSGLLAVAAPLDGARAPAVDVSRRPGLCPALHAPLDRVPA